MPDVATTLRSNDIEWQEGVQYPAWVDLSECGLDQFYTSSDTARHCLSQLHDWLFERGIEEDGCLFVEPSAGSGAFAFLLPENSISIDLEPKSNTIEKRDFLTWDVEADERIRAARESGKKIVAVGNPPFGTRGWIALSFLNKCAEFCDYCAFLLPMSFASEGKGSPKYRVHGMRNVKTRELLHEMFLLPEGGERKFNVVWQIWERGENRRETFDYVDENFVIKCIGDFSYRLCGQEFKKEADVFVPQGYFPGTPMSISADWSDILYGSGYGVKALNGNVDEMVDALVGADWDKHSTASTHGCRHVGMTEIKRVLTEALAPKG